MKSPPPGALWYANLRDGMFTEKPTVHRERGGLCVLFSHWIWTPVNTFRYYMWTYQPG